MLSRRQFLIGSSAALAAARLGPCWALPADDLAAARAALYAAYAVRLSALATWCDERKLAGEASRLRAWLPDRLADRQYLFVPNDFRDPPRAIDNQDSTGGQDAAAAKEAASRFTRCAAIRPPRFWPWLSVRRNSARPRWPASWRPKPPARTWPASGPGDSWAIRNTPAAGTRRSKSGSSRPAMSGTSDSAGYPALRSERYERGERLVRGHWLSDRDEARQRGGMKNASTIETEHYLVTSDAGSEEIVALGRQLERLRAVWQQVFTGYLVDEQALSDRLAGGQPLTAAATTKQKVIYYHNRQEYIAGLRAHSRKSSRRWESILPTGAWPTSSPASNRSPGRSITRPRISCLPKAGRSPRTWPSGRISGSSRARPATWNRSSSWTATTPWVGPMRGACRPPAIAGCATAFICRWPN